MPPITWADIDNVVTARRSGWLAPVGLAPRRGRAGSRRSGWLPAGRSWS